MFVLIQIPILFPIRSDVQNVDLIRSIYVSRNMIVARLWLPDDEPFEKCFPEVLAFRSDATITHSNDQQQLDSIPS